MGVVSWVKTPPLMHINSIPSSPSLFSSHLPPPSPLSLPPFYSLPPSFPSLSFSVRQQV